MFLQLRSALAGAWRRLAEPPDAISGAADRRRARLLSGLLILVAPLPLALLVLALANGTQAVVTNSLLLGLAVVAVCYALNRGGFYSIAAFLLIAGMYATVVMYAFAAQRHLPLAYLMITVLLSGMLYRPIATLYHFAISLALFGAFTAFTPLAASAEALNVFLFMCTLGGLFIVVTFLRQHDLDLIEQQTRELRSGERRLANILGTASEIIIAIDAEQNILVFNQAAERSFGYMAAEVMGQKLDRLLPQPFRDAHRQQVADFGSAPEAFRSIAHRTEFNGLRKDGSEFPMAAGISKLADEGRAVFTFFGSDITERKAADDALVRSEARYRALIEQAADGIFITDKQGRYLDVNPTACAMLGYTRAELIGADYRLILEPADVAQDPPDFELLLDGKTLKRERSYRRKDGTHFPVDISARLLSDGRALSIVRDVTERRAAQEALQRSEAQYRVLFEQAADGIFIWDEHGRYLEVNDSGCRLMGYTRAELIGSDFRLLMRPEDAAQDPPAYAQFRDGKTIKRERIYRRKDGTLFTGEISARLVSDGRVLTMVRDATERKAAQEALQQSETRYRALIDQAPDGVLITDVQGYFLDVNASACTMLGYSREELIGADARMLLDPEVVAHDPPNFELFLSGKVLQRERTYRRKDGTHFQTDNSARLISDGRILSIVRDTTERKEAEQALSESTARLRVGLSLVNLAIFQQDMDLRYAWMIQPQLGYEVEEVVGRTDAELLPAEAAAQIMHIKRRVLETGLKERAEVAVVADGQMLSYDLVAEPLRAAGGAIIGLVGATLDITERKAVERALRESEKEFRSLAEAMPQMVWITRADGWNIYFNQHWVDYTGLTLEESYGHGWNTPFHPDDRQRAREAWENATTHGATYMLECRLRRADGAYTWWLIRGVPQLDEQGAIVKWFGTCTDINSLKQAEARLEERLAELQRWHTAMLSREGRILDLKHEVNKLLTTAGQPPRYQSAGASAGKEP